VEDLRHVTKTSPEPINHTTVTALGTAGVELHWTVPKLCMVSIATHLVICNIMRYVSILFFTALTVLLGNRKSIFGLITNLQQLSPVII